MLKISLSTIIIIISTIMFFMNNPLSMGLLLLIQTLLICLITGLIINTYWFSYILFLIFLGGLLIMFIYISSIASNELFQISLNNTIYMTMFISFILLFFLIKFTNNLKFLNLSFNNEMNSFYYNFTFFNNENKMNLCKIYNNQTYPLMLLMIIYLFITLLSAVKICNVYQGPLRT